MHEHWEVGREVGIWLDFVEFLEFLGILWRSTNLGDVHFADCFAWLSFHKAEQTAPILVVVDEGFSEAAAMPIQNLLFGLLDQEQLDVAIDGLAAIWSADAIECAPLLIVLQPVANDLHGILGTEGSESIHDLDELLVWVPNINVIDGGGRDECQLGQGDPPPEDHTLLDFHVLES